ncbi:MAG: hypothetical protein HY897_15390 [Deltaproteobacteria bacterium]|nr:hypothetical protein [Deltaproteobacteria bacterium]
MRRLLAAAGAAAAFAIAVLVLPACTSPCDELASTICGCEKTRDRQDACRQTFVTGNPVSVSSERQDVCDRYLETCTCEALASGDYAACGLANQSAEGK